MNKINYKKVQIVLNIIVIICFLIYIYNKYIDHRNESQIKEAPSVQNYQHSKFVTPTPEKEINTFEKQAEKESEEYKKQGLAMGKSTRDYADRYNVRKNGAGVADLQRLFSHGWGGGKITDMNQFAALWHYRLNKESKSKLMGIASDLKSGKISARGFNNITGNNHASDFMKNLKMVISGDLNLTKLDPKIQKTWEEAITKALINAKTKNIGEGKEVGKNAVIDYEELAREMGK